MTPPRPLPDPPAWPHPITALRRWARRWWDRRNPGWPVPRTAKAWKRDVRDRWAPWLNAQPVGTVVAGNGASYWTRQDYGTPSGAAMWRSGGCVLSTNALLRQHDRFEVATEVTPELHRLRDRYPVQLHDGRCLRPCCADLDDQAFTDAFRRVSGEEG